MSIQVQVFSLVYYICFFFFSLEDHKGYYTYISDQEIVLLRAQRYIISTFSIFFHPPLHLSKAKEPWGSYLAFLCWFSRQSFRFLMEFPVVFALYMSFLFLFSIIVLPLLPFKSNCLLWKILTQIVERIMTPLLSSKNDKLTAGFVSYSFPLLLACPPCFHFEANLRPFQEYFQLLCLKNKGSPFKM